MENRNALRYPLRFPVIFKWHDCDEISRQGGGFTRDISTGGLFISSASAPPAGTPLAFEVLLPPLEAKPKNLKLQAEGRVARSEGNGFGVVILACDTREN